MMETSSPLWCHVPLQGVLTRSQVFGPWPSYQDVQFTKTNSTFSSTPYLSLALDLGTESKLSIISFTLPIRAEVVTYR
jgi:proteasome lid subunit RPN8/RPN11